MATRANLSSEEHGTKMKHLYYITAHSKRTGRLLLRIPTIAPVFHAVAAKTLHTGTIQITAAIQVKLLARFGMILTPEVDYFVERCEVRKS